MVVQIISLIDIFGYWRFWFKHALICLELLLFQLSQKQSML